MPLRIEKSREFTLVPWRPVLERQIGKPVSGILRDDGVSLSIGRGREGRACRDPHPTSPAGSLAAQIPTLRSADTACFVK
ncbi:DUF3363 domain-containing protein [Sphingomonas alpina]|uniref:DUF3363 domain-containing protein n=1 Tax=Sphingomonas alpina TaxID=653931 RepID=UPI0036F26A74